MKKLLILFLLFAVYNVQAQVSPVGKVVDESNLAFGSGTSVVSDPTANGGNAIFRASAAGSSNMWWGPYVHLQGGSYLIQFRLKVASNTLSSSLLNLDVVDNYGATSYGLLSISPNMFRNSNEWQVFTIPVQIPDNNNYIEIRGLGFQGGITDVSLDYINIMPGDARGLYSNEYTVTGNGAVGINTNYIPSGYQLAVNGTAIFTQAYVQLRSTWPDYVFKKDYQLKPLSEVKSYIEQNQHLPDIPAASTVEKDGINLGEMNKALLKKVEELTLYLIQKDNEIKDIKNELFKQQTEIENLHSKTKTLTTSTVKN